MEFVIAKVGVWSVVPPLIAITFALISKEVIPSLLLGIMSGVIIYVLALGLGPIALFSTTIDLMVTKIGANSSMFVFLALLGALVAVITHAGGSKAYGAWAARKLKTKESASFATVLLGFVVFIDDYFNCLAVGTVMKPVTDQHRVSREKLAYLIDATAAPICIIAPISSWAASIISYYPTQTGITGMQAFVSSIPMNLYAMLTIFMVLWVSLRKNADFGPMATAQRKADSKGSVNTSDVYSHLDEEIAEMEISDKGKVIDLLIPVFCLVLFSVIGMLFYGGLWDSTGKTIAKAFGDTNAGAALSVGGFGALIVAFLLFVPRKLISFKEFFAAITVGVKSMVPALIILSLAWTISGVCSNLLSTGEFVAGVVESSNLPIALIPVIIFIVAGLLSFATGTSWGTFGILIPITIAVCDIVAPYLSITALSAVLAGSIFGDHCSPISDTTILSSTGAGCNHIDHVSTQMPYSVLVALISLIGYVIAGFSAHLGFAISVAISISSSLIILVISLLTLPKVFPGKQA